MTAPERFAQSRANGFTDEQILAHLETHPEFGPKLQKSRDLGYSDDDIVGHLSKSPGQAQAQEPKDTSVNPLRVAGQVALGALERRTLPYDIAVSPLASEAAQTAAFREQIGEDVENLLTKKAFVGLDEEETDLLDNLTAQLSDVRRSQEFVKTVDLTARGLIGKATGIDTDARNFFEKAGHWYGFLKDPRELLNVAKDLKEFGLNPKSIANAITPGQDAARSAGAGFMLQLAEDENLGPLGTIAAAVIGDSAGLGGKALVSAASNPKQLFANTVDRFTKGNRNQEWVKQLSEDAKDVGVRLDIGTLTDSDTVKFLQTKAAQSSLTGNALDNFRKDMSADIVDSYKNLADTVGSIRFENNNQAADAIKNAVRLTEQKIGVTPQATSARPLRGRISTDPIPEVETEALLREISPTTFKSDYQAGQNLKTAAEDIRAPVKEKLDKSWTQFREELGGLEETQQELADELGRFVDSHRGSLLFGESSPESQVVRAAEKLRQRLEVRPVAAVVEEIDSQLLSEMRAAIGNTTDIPEINAKIIQWSRNPALGKRIANVEKQLQMDIFEIAENIATAGNAPRLIPAKLADLMKTKRTLGDLADWEFSGSNFKSAFKGLTGSVDGAIKASLGKSDPRLLNTFETLNALTQTFKQTFENSNLKSIFTPNNENYTKIFHDFMTNPDKFRTLEDILIQTERGNQLIGEMKREFAESFLSKNKLTDRNVNNLLEVIGPEFAGELNAYKTAVESAEEAAKRGTRAAARQRLGTEVPIVGKQATTGRQAKITPSGDLKRTNLRKFLNGKTDENIMSMMNTLGGIKRLRTALNTTPEGKQLFKELGRMKVEEMIGSKMQDAGKQPVKLGTFSKLASKREDRAILKELMGQDALDKLIKLQRVSGELSVSAQKFFNSSQTASTKSDQALLFGGVVSILSMNPWMLMNTLGAGVAMRTLSRLATDPEVLSLIEKNVARNKTFDVNKFSREFEKLTRPIVAETKKELLDEDS
jgi:hypothetical protein